MKTTEPKNADKALNDGQRLLELAREWLKQGNAAVAFQLLNQALKLKETENNKTLKGELSKEVGRVYVQNGEWDRAEDAYNQAKSIFLETGNFRGAAESARNLANLKFQLGDFSLSNILCESAIDWATKSGDFQLRATILNTQGAIKSIEGKQKESIHVFRLCLSDFRRSGNKLRQAYVLNNIGLAQTEIGQYQEAKTSFEEALSLALENRDLNLVALVHLNMAKLFIQMGDLIAARSLIKSARELSEILKSPAVEADLNIIEADAHRLSGDLKNAEDILERALHAARNHNLAQHEAEILYLAGMVAADRGDSCVARSRLEASIALFKRTGGGGLNKAVERLKVLDETINRNLSTSTQKTL
jgi:tetratricopeptide (TPR) repeat protein